MRAGVLPCRAARLGNGWQPIVQRPPADLPPSELREKIAILTEQAEAAGRDPGTITIALGATVQFADGRGNGVFSGSSQQIIDGISQYQEAGVQDFRFDFPAPSIEGVLSRMERFAAEVRPHVA